MEKIKRFNDYQTNESVMSSIDSYVQRKISDKYLNKIKDKISSMSREEKISYVEKIISKKERKSRYFVFAIIPAILSIFTFNFLTSPIIISYFTIKYILQHEIDSLKEYKNELYEIKDELEKEIDNIKED